MQNNPLLQAIEVVKCLQMPYNFFTVLESSRQKAWWQFLTFIIYIYRCWQDKTFSAFSISSSSLGHLLAPKLFQISVELQQTKVHLETVILSNWLFSHASINKVSTYKIALTSSNLWICLMKKSPYLRATWVSAICIISYKSIPISICPFEHSSNI